MADEPRTTALKCLELLFSRFRQGVNFQALITKELMEQLEADELEAIFKLSEGQDLRAEKASSTEVFSSYRGPAMLKLESGHWILLVNSGQYQKQDSVTIYDPRLPEGRNTALVPKQQLDSKLGDTILIFHNLAEIDIARHSRLYALSMIARHHNVRFNLPSVMHEYAVGEEEIRDTLLRKIASDFEFKTKKLKLSWKKLVDSRDIFPAMIWKKNEKAAILCGVRKTEEETTIVVIDPESSEATGPNPFIFLKQEEFEANYTYNINFFKKTYKLVVFLYHLVKVSVTEVHQIVAKISAKLIYKLWIKISVFA